MRQSHTPDNFAVKFGLTRRVWLGAALLLGGVGSADAAPATLPLAKSLREELARALKGGNPLLVMVSLAACPFCKVARERYLGPMRAHRSLPVVQLDMHSTSIVQDFKGVAFTHEKLVQAWNVTLAPTVLFFGRNGAEAAPRLAGFASPDYYGFVLDQRLEQARAVIKAA